MKDLDESKIYDLSELTNGELISVWNYLMENGEDWEDCPFEEMIKYQKTDRLVFNSRNWGWDSTIKPTANAKELFYTLENIQKENVYIDLRGKSEEELTDLYNFLESVGEEQYDLTGFLDHCKDYEIYHLGNNWTLGWYSTSKGKKEVTIPQLKEILQPMETPMICTQEQAEAPKLVISNIDVYKTFGQCSKKQFDAIKLQEKEFDLSMCRIIVNNQEQSKKLQELAFKQGYSWSSKSKIITNTHMNVLYFNSEDYRITFSDLNFDDSNFKTLHFTDVFKEFLQEKEQRLLKELEEVRKEIEDSKIKVGDWVWNNFSECYYKKTSCLPDLEERKITNQELIKLLEQEIK